MRLGFVAVLAVAFGFGYFSGYWLGYFNALQDEHQRIMWALQLESTTNLPPGGDASELELNRVIYLPAAE